MPMKKVCKNKSFRGKLKENQGRILGSILTAGILATSITSVAKANDDSISVQPRSYYYFNNYYTNNPNAADPGNQNFYYVRNIKNTMKGKYLYGEYKRLVIKRYGYVDKNKNYVFLYDNKIYQRHIYTHKGQIVNIRLLY